MKKTLALVCFIIAFVIALPAAIVITGDISTNTTFLMSNNPHQIRGNVRVLDGVTLTIEPGVNLLFENGSSLEIQGQISAVGTAALPIIFYSDGTNQHYTRVLLNGAEGSTFNHCNFSRSRDNTALLRIENSGTVNILNSSFATTINAHGIYIFNSTVNIDDIDITSVSYSGVYIKSSLVGGNPGSTVSLNDVFVDGCQTGVSIEQGSYPTLTWTGITVHHSSSYPLYASIYQYATLTGVSVSWAGIAMLAMWESYLYSSCTLPYRSLPYYALGNLNLNNGAVLTLQPGVGLRLPQYGKIILQGGSSLTANGTALLPITMNAGGDYYWKGISLDSNCSAQLDYCQLNRCGYPEYGPEPVISTYNAASLSISNTTISGGTSDGIVVTGSSAFNLTLNNVHIEDCPGTGLYIVNGATILDYTNLSITGCGRPLQIPANLLDFLDEQPVLADNTHNRIFLHNNGYLYRDTTIRDWGYPYVCESIDINVNWVNFTIDPGCVIQMGYSQGFYVNGTINAVGTAEDPIRITRLPGSTQNWRGFYLNEGTSYAHFNHCILEHCASSNQYNHIQDAFTIYRADTVLIENTQIIDAYCRAVFLESSNSDDDDVVINNLSIDGCGMDAVLQYASGYNLTINGLTVNGCNAFPVSVSANWAHQITGFTLTNNAHNVIRFLNGGYLVSQTLANHGYPYQISGSPLYVNYTNVTFLPGTVFYFEQSRSLEVSGTLTAHGTAENPIIFDRPAGAEYFWDRIYLHNNSNASFAYCQFNNCGLRNEYGYDNAFIDNAGATSLTLQNCTITNVDAQAISCHDIGSGDSVQISNVVINGCRTDGFWCNDGDINLSINGLSITNCLRNPISILPMLAGCIENISLSGNTNNDIRLFSYNGINGTVHFANHGYTYRCEEGIIGNGGSNVSFAPGCIFWIADNRPMSFYGSVNATGTASEPIVFTRYPSSSNYWLGFLVSSGSGTFAHCQILYGGAQETYGARRAFTDSSASSLSITNCLIQYSYGDGFVCLDKQSAEVLTVSNLSIVDVAAAGFVSDVYNHTFSVNGMTITNPGTWPIYTGVDILDRFANVTITNPGTPFVGLGKTTQTHDATWPQFGYPYRTSSSIQVNDWVTLNMVAGTQIVFDNYILYQNEPRIMVYGALNTMGTAEHPVVFRGLNIETPSTWKGVRIYQPDAVCNLDCTQILNAGLDENHTPNEEFCALYIYRGTVNLTGCRIGISNHNLLKMEYSSSNVTLNSCQLDSAGNGILHYDGALNLANNTITAHIGTGVLHYGGTLNFGSEPSQWNRIYGNTLNLRNYTANPKSAPYVYWGSLDPDVIDAAIWDNEEGAGIVDFEPWYDANCQNLYYYTIDIPQNVALTKLSPTQLRISWSPVETATSYTVYVADSPDSADWDILAENITAYELLINLIEGQCKRFYYVTAKR